MYKIIYDEIGKPSSIQKDNMTIPICDGNRHYQEFLEWNAKQKTPIDITKTIVVKKSAEEIDGMRRSAYQTEADPLFFKAERGEIDKQVWIDKVKEIKERIK